MSPKIPLFKTTFFVFAQGVSFKKIRLIPVLHQSEKVNKYRMVKEFPVTLFIYLITRFDYKQEEFGGL